MIIMLYSVYASESLDGLYVLLLWFVQCSAVQSVTTMCAVSSPYHRLLRYMNYDTFSSVSVENRAKTVVYTGVRSHELH